MFSYLKQSTASQSRMVGPFIDDTDFKTVETALTIANTDVKISKNGAAGVNKNSGGGTHRNNGMYSLTFDATDTDTVGELEVSILVSGALVVVAKYWVLEESIYDALFGASAAGFDANQRVDIGSFLGNAVQITNARPETVSERLGAQAKLDVNAEADTALSDIHLDHLLAVDYDPASKPGVATALLNELVESDGGVSRFTANSLEQGPDTDHVGTGSGLSAIPWNSAWDAEVESEVNDALVAVGLDHLVSASVAGTDIADNSIIAKMVSKSATADWDSFVNTTDSLEALRDRGDAAWTTGGGGSIDEILSVHPLIPMEIDLANTATWRLGLMLTNALDDLPSTAEIDPGTISIDRKAIGGTSWSAVVTDAACSEIAGLIYYDEVFDSGSGYAEGDSLRITFKSQKITVAANDYEIIGTTGRIFYTSIRQTMRGTDSALLASANGSGFTAIPWNTAWDAEVESEVSDALVAIHLDHLLAADYDPASKPGVATALLNELVESDAGVSRFTANSLEQAPDTDHVGTGSGLSAIPWNSAWDAEVESEVNDALVALHLDHLLAADYDPASKPGVGTALLNELVENDVGVSRFTSNALEQGPGGGDGSGFTAIPWNSAWDAEVESEVADALDAAIPGSPTSNSINERIKTMDDAYTAARGAFLDNLNGHTPQTGDSFARIGINGAGLSAIPWNASWDAEVQSEVNDALVAINLDHLMAATVTSTDVADRSVIAKLVSKSGVADWDTFNNAEDSLEAVSDTLDTIAANFTSSRAEPGQGAPPASATFLSKLDYVYKVLRNKKINDGSNINIYGDDEVTIHHKIPISDSGGSTTQGEMITGA